MTEFFFRQACGQGRLVSFLLLISALLSCSMAYQPAVLGRRQALVSSTTTVASGILGVSSLLLPNAAAHATSSFEVYNDPLHGFSFQVPTSWQSQEQILADRRKIRVWTDPTDTTTSLFVAYTPVRDDFTSLGSFGSVDQVAEQTILPKSKLMDPSSEVTATMLSAKSEKQAYLFDYVQAVGSLQPETHFRTIFTLKQGATGAAGAMLITVTAQTPEATYGNVKSTLDTIIDSFGKSV